MIERWNIKRCQYIRKELLHASAKDIGDRLYMKRQTILNWETGAVRTNIESHEMLYTLALKDILEERGTTVEELVSNKANELKELL